MIKSEIHWGKSRDPRNLDFYMTLVENGNSEITLFIR